MLDRTLLLPLALGLLQCFFAARLRGDDEPEPEEDFVRLRRPVLGFVIERSASTAGEPTGGRHRIVALEDGRVLHTGTLDECEGHLVDTLLERFGRGRPNVALKTLGGWQLWEDVFWYAGWRIQTHVFTGHHRLLSPDEARRAWGSYEACRAVFEEVRHREHLTLESDHLVVLLHGLGRTRRAFGPLRDALRSAGYAVLDVGYPSTRRSIAEHAASLERLLDSQDDVHRLSFVTHSLGGVVVRAALGRDAAWRGRMQLSRLVMLSPPSRGSAAARALRPFLPFRAIAGPAAVELGGELAAIPPPPLPFGIVAGARGGERGFNPFLEGPDDGVLAVSETVLENADDFLVVAGTHTFLMRNPTVIDAVTSFLATGRFAPLDGPLGAPGAPASSRATGGEDSGDPR